MSVMSADKPKRETMWSTQIQVGRWQQGEAEAMGALFERFTPLVRYRIRGHSLWASLSATHSLDDLCQEVWMRIVSSPPDSFTPQGKGAFAAWLGQIADCALRDLQRKKTAAKRGGGKDPSTLDTQFESDGPRFPGERTPEGPVGKARIAEFERLAGKVLAERELKAWVWVGLLGYTAEEAAMGLATTASSVRGLLLRSRSKLQEALGSSAASLFAQARRKE